MGFPKKTGPGESTIKVTNEEPSKSVTFKLNV